MPLNNLGDFLAGVFGPLAIFWLILGFLQQGKELQQNTEALEMQADELKKSVNQEKNLRSSVLNQLTERMIVINEYFKDSGLPNPYDDGKEKDKQAKIDYEKKGTALFLHLNILYLMYENRAILGKKQEEIYKTWFNNVVVPWMKRDKDIEAIWNEAKSHGDLLGKDFFSWLIDEK
jgi:Fe2+ transport system protein B